MPEIVTYWDRGRCEYRLGVVVRRISRGRDKGKVVVRAVHVARRVVRCEEEDIVRREGMR